MANRVVHVNALNYRSWDGAALQVFNFKKQLSSRIGKLVQTCASHGVSVLSASISTVSYAGDLSSLTTGQGKFVWNGSKCKTSVQLNGDIALFVEFGTGLYSLEIYDSPDLSELNVSISARGTFGKGHGSNPNGWYYPASHGFGSHPSGTEYARYKNNAYSTKSIHTYGNGTNPILYNARKDIEANLTGLINDAFQGMTGG